MRKEDFFEIIGDIDEKYIEGKSVQKRGMYTWLAAAACFVLLAVAVIPMFNGNENVQPKNGGNTNVKELFAEKKNDIAVNKVERVMSSDIDVKITSYSKNKIPLSVWERIISDFEEFTGLGYEELELKLSENMKIINFYSMSVRGYKDGGLSEKYSLHDYVFDLENENGGRITVALSPVEEPLRDCFFNVHNPEKSSIEDNEVVIYKFKDSYIAQFSYNDVSYDIETDKTDLAELTELIGNILKVPSKPVEDVPADENGMYMEQIDSEDLNDEAAFFGGSYINERGSFVVVLTDDTADNREKISKALNMNEENIVFETGEYTLNYLTELQEKISTAMVNKELSFITSSAVREDLNRVVITALTDEESKLAEVKALDSMGGAIEFKFTEGGAKGDLIDIKR